MVLRRRLRSTGGRALAVVGAALVRSIARRLPGGECPVAYHRAARWRELMPVARRMTSTGGNQVLRVGRLTPACQAARQA